MSWIFTPITIPASTTKATPTQVNMELVTGQIRQVAVFMPATTNDHQAGVRITAPQGLVFPTRANGSDDWLYSYTVFYKEVFITRLDLGFVAPVQVTIEGHNSDSVQKIAQVGVYIEPYQTEVEIMLRNINAAIAALKQASQSPEFVKQIDLFISLLTGGVKDE